MINWIVLLFGAAGFLIGDFFDINSMLFVNLPLISLLRSFYLITFYLRYIRAESDGSDAERSAISLKEKAYFIFKNALIIGLGFLFLWVALFIGIYSLLCGIFYLKHIFEKEENPLGTKIINILYYLIPIGFIGFYFFIEDYYNLSAVLLATTLFHFWGQNYAELTYGQLKERYERRLMNRIPLSLQILVIFLILGVPLLLLINLYFWGIELFDWTYLFAQYVFDADLITRINLPIIIVSTVFYIPTVIFIHMNSNDEREKNFEIEQKVLVYFLISRVLMVLAAVFIVYATLIISTYFLLTAVLNIYSLHRRQHDKPLQIFSIFLLLLIPTFITVIITYYYDPVGLPFLIISAAIPFLLNIPSLISFKRRSLRDTFAKISGHLAKTGPNILKYTLLIYIIAIPITVLMGLHLFGPFEPRKETVMIEMRDGTKLATDIYYSPLAWNYFTGEPEEAPVILVRTPYGKAGMGILYYNLYCSQGYHVVIQDFRGTHDSEGSDDFLLFTKDYMDAPDTIDWILDRDWCNGLIGSSGISALCITQYMYAPTAQEELKCQALWFGTPDLIRDAILEGAFHNALVNYWIEGVAPDNYRKQMDIIYDTLQNISLLEKEYARSVTLEEHPNTYGNVSTPAIHIGGWYDHFLKGTIRGYMGYDDYGGKGARGKQRLILGPWTHGMVFSQSQGELIYPESANALTKIIKWEKEIFDESLKGIKQGNIWEQDRVMYYLMGHPDDENANYWKYADDWPLNYEENPWYLGRNMEGNNVIVDDETDLNGYNNLSYLYDPRDPISTRGGNNEPGYTEKGAGPFDQRPVEVKDGENFMNEGAELREDLLLFTSEEFDEPYTVEGNLKAHLFVKSSANDTDFMVKLVDVYPDGRRMLIIDSALTMRFWNMSMNNYWAIGTDAEAELSFIKPGKEYEIVIDLAAIAYRFDRGHRIGITIQSSNYDRFTLNSNTGGPITEHYSESVIANNTIITGPGKSAIIFPELK